MQESRRKLSCTCQQPMTSHAPMMPISLYTLSTVADFRVCSVCYSAQLMLGSLRESEVELLSENMRFAITETCLALTIFREELR
jgi:hypothetical protein